MKSQQTISSMGGATQNCLAKANSRLDTLPLWLINPILKCTFNSLGHSNSIPSIYRSRQLINFSRFQCYWDYAYHAPKLHFNPMNRREKKNIPTTHMTTDIAIVMTENILFVVFNSVPENKFSFYYCWSNLSMMLWLIY